MNVVSFKSNILQYLSGFLFWLFGIFIYYKAAYFDNNNYDNKTGSDLKL